MGIRAVSNLLALKGDLYPAVLPARSEVQMNDANAAGPGRRRVTLF